MTNTQPLTKDDLRSVLKELDVATKGDLKQFATKEDLERFSTKKDLEKLATKEDLELLATKDDLLHLERRLKLRMGKHRNEIFTMFGKLATSTPSRREFNELKLRA